ncbi:hypothetical protein K402DRAFT_376455 [Aulographum hederae CBS 113979]|uniref:Kinetochore protein NDC80 n=1 Tax=Aulographum hederae CBS 113979 TaxID=1176131 RepID=A0A6G1H1M2_9PEZI|nr:hypothetical protein K402DRAFT_376455 [Aulographum hederae CBS 113979]
MADQGLFSVRRPRETLAAINHNASAIPMPSSAMKRSTSVQNFQQAPHTGHARSTSGSRMSLAPGRPQQPVFQRSSSGSNIAEMGFTSTQRNSNGVFGGGGSAGTRKSYAPISTPAHAQSMAPDASTAQRRSSVYSARPSAAAGPFGGGVHQSFFVTAPGPAGIPADPRRLTVSSVKAQMAHELQDYLTHNNFEMEAKHSLTAKSLTSPTQKDFNMMFQWLYHRLDPAYRFLKNMDSEVPPLLKQLRYPFEKSIMKTQITAVGGNNWHTFLGLLHWMMQLAKMMDAYARGEYDEACAEAGVDVSGDRIIFDFLSDAYREWLSVDDDDEDEEAAAALLKPYVDRMAAKFDGANKHHLEQVEMLEAEAKSLADQIEELGRTGEREKKLDEQIQVFEEDRGKFEAYNNTVEAKIEKYLARQQLFETEIRNVEKELEDAEEERRQLQESVDAQGITIQDIDRMNADRERLQKGVEATLAKMEESRRKATERELEAEKKLEELESLIDKYNSLGYQIGIIPSTATNAKGIEYQLVLSVNDGAPNFTSSQMGRSSQDQPGGESERLLAGEGTGYAPHNLLNLDLKHTIKSHILTLRKDISERRNTLLEQDMNNHDLLDKIKEAMDDKLTEVEGLGHRVRAAEEEFEKTRELVGTQKSQSDAQIEKMEKELGRMRQGVVDSVQLMEQREINVTLEYEQLTLRAASLREELHTEIERMLNDVIKFKVHIQKSLEDYEGFVAEEVDRECAGMEEEDAAADAEMDEELADD